MKRFFTKKMFIMSALFFLAVFLPNHMVSAGEAVSYAEYLAEYEGAASYNGDNIELHGGKARVNIDEPGFYNIMVRYTPAANSSGSIERNVIIDGEIPFKESMNFILEKKVIFEQYPFLKDDYGNDRMPRQTELSESGEIVISDREALISGFLRFYLEKGEHEISIEGGKGNADIYEIILCPPYAPPSYEEYRAGIDGTDETGDVLITIEAEAMDVKSGKSIIPSSISDAGVTPTENGKQTLNAIGVDSFEDAGDYGEWNFMVERNGFYRLTFKYKQNSNVNLNSYRTIYIDGVVPFTEFEAVAFPFSAKWRNLQLDGTPVYLEEGRHSVRLSVTSAPYSTIANELKETISKVRELDLEVKSIIGSEADVYRIWRLESYIPDLSGQLSARADELEALIETVTGLTGFDAREYRELQSAISDLQKFAEKPDDLAKSADSLKLVYEPLTDWLIALEKQPVVMDKFYIHSESTTTPKPTAGFLAQLTFSVRNFVSSFVSSANIEKKDDADGIKVWVKRNRDYVNLMQQMCDEYFTPETGISVNVNYIPDNNVLVLANASGNLPELATGIDMSTPFEYAMRGALVDLSRFDGYDELIEPIAKGSLVPYHFLGGDYGLPEEVIFNVLYYRTDIMNRLDIRTPNTWDDVLELIPVLFQNNYTFFYPYGDYQTFYTQSEVQVYTPDGLSLACDTEEGFAAFKFWTDLYVKYGLPPKMESFYQHFRLGDAPLGVASVNEYIRFERTAPDIAGYWKVALLPGTTQTDGTINRSQAGNQNGVMMFKTDEDREQRAWKFIQWWLDTQTQSIYAENLENYYGPEFRWYTANYDVMAGQSWDDDTKEVFLQQLEWYNPVPYVPGGSYMTGREIWNTWTKVVIDKLNYREQLEIAYDDIQREMERKQLEFGLIDANGNVLKTLDFLQVDLPSGQ